MRTKGGWGRGVVEVEGRGRVDALFDVDGVTALAVPGGLPGNTNPVPGDDGGRPSTTDTPTFAPAKRAVVMDGEGVCLLCRGRVFCVVVGRVGAAMTDGEMCRLSMLRRPSTLRRRDGAGTGSLCSELRELRRSAFCLSRASAVLVELVSPSAPPASRSPKGRSIGWDMKRLPE